MNLAEFPMAILSTRNDPNIKTLEFQDSVKGKNGELINRKWIITGADKFGLPTASDEEVILGLMKLTVDDGLKARKIHFTRYELMKILRWPTEGRNYSRLQKALDRLSGVRIKATNAFYDNELKNHSTRNFGIIDGYEINDGRDGSGKMSFFTWSEVLFKSFQAGFIKKLDIDFYLDLKGAVSKRLYRYLDKHFWYKSRVQIDLLTLAHEKLGISRNYRFVSSIRQQLDPAIHELVERGFLSSSEVISKGKGADIVFFAATGKARVESSRDMPLGASIPKALASASETGLDDVRENLGSMLSNRGIQTTQACRIIQSTPSVSLGRVRDIINYFDDLCSSGGHQTIKNPAGFLYKAVSDPDVFMLPRDSKKLAQQSTFNFGSHNERVASSASQTKSRPVQSADEDNEALYEMQRREHIAAIKRDTDAAILSKITKEVEKALSNIRDVISPERWNEVVVHGVEEKLARLNKLPEYAEWKRQH